MICNFKIISATPPFHEEGGFFGTCYGEQYVVHAEPGKDANPAKDKEASNNVFKAADGSTLPNDVNATIEGAFHTHPDGTVTETVMDDFGSGSAKTKTSEFIQPLYADNIKNAQSNTHGVRGNHYVLAQGDSTVYICNGNGVQAAFPFTQFFSIGNEK